MLLKRIYGDADEGEGISVIHTGVARLQNFSRRFVETGIVQGWLTLSRGALTLHAQEEDLQYRILGMPGRYCLHCGLHWPGDPTGAETRAHISAEHAGMVSPDPQWPQGYRATESYECLLSEEQHARWKAPAYATVSHARWKE